MEITAMIAIAEGAFKIGTELYSFISNERSRLQQTGEWTDAQEQAWDKLQAQRAGQPWQQPQG